MSQSAKMGGNSRRLQNLTTLAHDVPKFGGAKIAAILVKNGEVLSYGFNRRKTHPLQKKYASKPQQIYLHAEIDAIQKALRRTSATSLRGAKLYLARAFCNGKPATVEPCPGCRAALLFYGITLEEHT